MKFDIHTVTRIFDYVREYPEVPEDGWRNFANCGMFINSPLESGPVQYTVSDGVLTARQAVAFLYGMGDAARVWTNMETAPDREISNGFAFAEEAFEKAQRDLGLRDWTRWEIRGVEYAAKWEQYKRMDD